MNPEADEAPLARIEAGDREALAAVWARHRQRLLRHVEKKLRRVPVMRRVVDEEDVVQAVYLEAARELPGYLRRSPRLDPYVWLVGLARRQLGNCYESHLDAKKRNLRSQQSLPEGAGDLHVDAAPGPVERAMANEAAEMLGECLARLEAPDRQILQLAYLEMRTLREAAERIAISEDAAAQRASRARRRLRSLLAGGGSLAG
jgi:RNA polymerase sigma-70 factor (ECF subfamily)